MLRHARQQPRRAATVVIQDTDGNPLESWQVPLDVYLAAHEGECDEYNLRQPKLTEKELLTSIHGRVIARALIHDKKVPEEVTAQHDPALLQKALDQEKSFHEQGKRFCKQCKASEDSDA